MVDVAADVGNAVKSLDARRMALRDYLAHSPVPPGLVPVDDRTFLAAWNAMVKQYPPEQIRMPDGRVVVESPWVIMLAYVDGGRAVLDRMLSIKRKHEADPSLLNGAP